MENSSGAEEIGEKIGYGVMFLVFATVLFFILLLLGKLPESWTYFNVVGLTILIVLVGKSLKKILEL